MTHRIAAFVSIPKNASNSIRDMLNMGPHREIDDTDLPIVHECHKRASLLIEKWPDLFTFAFVRCPFARCFSWYTYHKNITPYSQMEFSQWVLEGMPHHWKQINDTDWTDKTPLIQSNFLDSEIDFIGHLEQLEADMHIVTDKLNAASRLVGLSDKFAYQNLHLNHSVNSFSIGTHYTTATRKLTEQLLEEDFERFNY